MMHSPSGHVYETVMLIVVDADSEIKKKDGEKGVKKAALYRSLCILM